MSTTSVASFADPYDPESAWEKLERKGEAENLGFMSLGHAHDPFFYDFAGFDFDGEIANITWITH